MPRAPRPLLLSLVAALILPATVAACNVCRDRKVVKIKRDSTFEKVRQTQEELGMWCSWCDALGLYDEDAENGPCLACSSPGIERAPGEAAGLLEVHVTEWWGDRPGRAIFISTPECTLSTDMRDMPLKAELRAFAAQRKMVAQHTPGRAVARGKVMGRHERAHLWIQRMLDMVRFCNDIVGLDPEEVSDIQQSSYALNAALFHDASEGEQLNSRIGSLYRRGASNLSYAGATGSVSADDVACARIMHNLGHIWVERLYGASTKKGIQGWLISGVKLHTQVFFCAGVSTSVATEVATARGWGGPRRMRSPIWKKVKKDKAEFAEMLATQWEAMSINHQMLSWSLVEYLSSTSRPKFEKLIRGLVVEQLSMSQALRKSHNWTVGMLTDNWKRYVIRAYRGDERKTLPVRGYKP